MNQQHYKKYFQRILIGCVLIPGLALTGCGQFEADGEDDDDNEGSLRAIDFSQQVALIATAGDFGSQSGAHALMSTVAPYNALTNLAPTSTTDLGVACYGQAIFRLEKFGRNSITKFSLEAPTSHEWQYSTTDADDEMEFSNSNPYDVISVSDTKAYVIRYGSPDVWIVDPSAGNGANFKTGMLDLRAYADADGKPEIASGVVVNGKLFLAMQRIDYTDNYLPGTAYVAVFDTVTDTEIDTGTGSVFKGVQLPAKNPLKMEYLAANDTIYLQAVGKYEGFVLPAYYDGGIVTLNPNDYQTSLLVDDGDADTHIYGNIINMALVSPQKGYFVGYAEWADTSLYSFNPTTGSVDGQPVAQLEHLDISDINVDNTGRLWVGRRGDAGITLVDSNTDQILEPLIATDLNPIQIVFCGG